MKPALNTGEGTTATGRMEAAVPASSRENVQRMLVKLSPYIALIALIIYFSFASPVFLTTTNLENMIREGAILLLIALGGTFVILLGSIDLSVGAIVTLTGMSAAYLSQEGWSTPTLLMAVVAVGLLSGLANGVIHAYGRIPSFLATLGTSFIFVGLAQQTYGATPITFNDRALVDALSGLAVGVPVVGLIAVLLLLACIGLATNGALGRYIYAIGGNERVGRLAGLPVKRVKVVTFMLSGVLCAIAGLFLTIRITSASGDMGEALLLPSIAAVVIGGTQLTGGVGGPLHTLLGVALLEVLLNGMTLLSVNPFMQLIIAGAVVIVAVGLAALSNTEPEIVK